MSMVVWIIVPIVQFGVLIQRGGQLETTTRKNGGRDQHKINIEFLVVAVVSVALARLDFNIGLLISFMLIWSQKIIFH